jgi:disulfide bond formation protein DsbB
MNRSSLLLVGAATASVGAVGAALYTQHVLGMQPCPWCVLQRLIFLSIAAAALIGLVAQRLGPILMIGLAVCGMAAALWQHFVAAATASCNLSFADRVMSGLTLDELAPAVFMATASCADAKVNLLGVPYEFWSLGLFVMLESLATWTLVQRLRRG